MRRTFFELVSGFAEASGCESNIQEGNCQATLTVEGLEFQLGMIEESGLVLIQTGVALLPDQDREEFCMGLLAANNLFNQTRGLTLGIDRSIEIVTVQLSWELAHLDAERFANLMGNMLAMAAEWMERLADWTAPQPELAKVNDADLAGAHFIRV